MSHVRKDAAEYDMEGEYKGLCLVHIDGGGDLIHNDYKILAQLFTDIGYEVRVIEKHIVTVDEAGKNQKKSH